MNRAIGKIYIIVSALVCFSLLVKATEEPMQRAATPAEINSAFYGYWGVKADVHALTSATFTQTSTETLISITANAPAYKSSRSGCRKKSVYLTQIVSQDRTRYLKEEFDYIAEISKGQSCNSVKKWVIIDHAGRIPDENIFSLLKSITQWTKKTDASLFCSQLIAKKTMKMKEGDSDAGPNCCPEWLHYKSLKLGSVEAINFNPKESVALSVNISIRNNSTQSLLLQHIGNSPQLFDKFKMQVLEVPNRAAGVIEMRQ